MASAVLFYLGAGQGERAEACKQRYQPTHTVLVDGQAHTASRLDSVQQASVKRMWITHDGQPATFYHYNLAEFDGLRKASALKELFPNLKLKSSEEVETVAVHQLVGQTLAEHDGNNHVLVIDIPGQELALLKALAEHKLIQRFEYIEVVTCQEAWFDGVNVTTETVAQLKEYGFKTVAATLDDDPDFPVLAVYRDAVAEENRVLKERLKQLEDAKKQIEAEKQTLQEEKQKQANWTQSLKNQLEEAQQAATTKEQELSKAKQLADERKKQIDEAQEASATQNKTFEAQKQQLEAEKQKQANWAQSLKKQLEEAQQERDKQQEYHKHHRQRAEALANELHQVKAEKEALEQAIKTLKDSFGEAQSLLVRKVDELRSSQDAATKKLTHAITSSTANTTKQIEAFIGVQQFLQTGDTALNFHGWPISSDIAVYLLQKIKQENFDLIIEFGSGTSTVMFATAIAKLYELQSVSKSVPQAKGIEFSDNKASSTRVRHYDEHEITDVGDIPKRIIAFEHNKKYWQQTTDDLNVNGVGIWADVVHAPLVEYSYEEQDYLHYDCDKTLAKLADLLEGRQGKILVLVDGPPGATCQHARFPALPKLLKAFGKYELHIVLDDYNRKEEIEVSEKWLALLKQRSVLLEETELNFEKKALELVLNKV